MKLGSGLGGQVRVLLYPGDVRGCCVCGLGEDFNVSDLGIEFGDGVYDFEKVPQNHSAHALKEADTANCTDPCSYARVSRPCIRSEFGLPLWRHPWWHARTTRRGSPWRWHPRWHPRRHPRGPHGAPSPTSHPWGPERRVQVRVGLR